MCKVDGICFTLILTQFIYAIYHIGIYIYIGLYWSYFREAFVSTLSSSPTLVDLLLKADGSDISISGSWVHRALQIPVLQCVP